MNDIRQHIFNFTNPDKYLNKETKELKIVEGLQSMITVEQIKAFSPTLNDNKVNSIVEAINKSPVFNNILQIAHFLAQTAHESNSFNVTVENLNYSSKGLLLTFSKYFKTIEEADRYARNPQKIANKVYANRMDNGNESSGDGYKFRGRGYMQLTGKANYRLYSVFAYKDERLLNNPDLVSEGFDCINSAIWYWHVNGINKYADKDDVLSVSKKINLGNANSNATPKGLDDRIDKLKKIKKILGIK